MKRGSKNTHVSNIASSNTFLPFLLDSVKVKEIRDGKIDAEYNYLRGFLSSTEAEKRDNARKAIEKNVLDDLSSILSPADRLALALSWQVSESAIPGYATLNEKHLADIEQVKVKITAYQDDLQNNKPLNFIMLASPGNGKSHFVDCVSKSLSDKKVVACTFNMAGMGAPADLITPLNEVRNLKVEDKMPLLFLDEFDSKPENYSLLLPLMWDGVINVGNQTLKLGRSIIALAGSNRMLPEILDQARSMKRTLPSLEKGSEKLTDLFSRINGSVINIPSLDSTADVDDRKFDKVVIALQLLKRRFPKVKSVPLAFLRFIGSLRFRYDVRSIKNVVDYIARSKHDDRTSLRLSEMPKEFSDIKFFRESSLPYHLIDEDDNAHGVVKKWEKAASVDQQIMIDPPSVIANEQDDLAKISIAFALEEIGKPDL
jgi:hypothetical protein